jgi:predicted ATPase
MAASDERVPVQPEVRRVSRQTTAVRSRRLVGRDREIADVAETIASVPLTTVTGPGGVGKTALALAVAAESSARFPDGVFVVWLASLRSADLVAGEVAAQVGLQRSGGESNVDALTRWLADRDLLLVLDNCEHVVSAVAQLVEELTARLPRLHVLATSREPLWVMDELNHRLAPLTVAGTDAGRAEIDACPAVRLFRERAGDRMPTSLDTDRAVGLMGEICRRVDGLPLAIELAAAMVAGLELEDISRHLDDLFDLLPHAARRADGSQRSLRATVEWSDALLPEDERRLLRRMAVFAGGFDLAAINAVCASEGQSAAKVAGLTGRLVEKSLLLKHEATGQYQLLETIRQYATEQLALAGELDAIRDRHAYCYLEIGLRESGATMTGPERPHLEVLHRIEDNTRVALERLLKIHPEAALGLAASLNIFWWTQGKLREGISWLERAREVAPDAPAELRATSLFCEAFLVGHDTDDWQAAATLLDLGIDTISDTISDTDEPPLILGMLLCLRGECDVFNGDPKSALALTEAGYDIAARYPGSWGQGFCAWNVGNARRAIGDEDGALAMFMKCHEVGRTHGYGIADMVACNDVGRTWEERGVLDAARDFWERALQLRRDLGALRIGYVHGTMSTALLAVARVAEQQGDLATTSKLLREGLPLAEEMREVETARLMAELLRKTTQAESMQRAILRPQDGIWRIEFNGTNLHVPDLKGLWHLRELVARPHQPVPALSLVGATSETPLPSADTGPILDQQALMRYRRRLAELDDELDAAAIRGDTKRHAERSAERDALIAELKRATGLGGRPRRSGSPTEKARLNVTRTIRHAINELASRAPDLAAHLDQSIVTGVSCCYEPAVDIAWTT